MSAYPKLSELARQGKRESTAKDYVGKLSRMYEKLQGLTFEFEDVRWLSQKEPILQHLMTIKPSMQSGIVCAIRGTLKGVDLYDLWADESMTMIEKPDIVPKQSYTPREEENWASHKDMLDKMRSLEPYVTTLLQRRRECRAQKGFAATPLVLSIKDRKILLQWLTLSLYAQTAPCRNDMSDLPIVNVTEGNPFNNPENCLICKDPNKRPYPQYTLCLSYFKTSRTLGTIVREMPWVVNKHIFESLRIWPRQYLLPQLRDGDKPMGRNYFSAFFAGIFDDKNVTSTVARKAWVTMKFGHEKTAEEKAKEARDMMHSPAIQSRHYLKFRK